MSNSIGRPLNDDLSILVSKPTLAALRRRLPCCAGRPSVACFFHAVAQSIVVDPKSFGSINSSHGLILFDGVCVLCSRLCPSGLEGLYRGPAGFVSTHDRRGYFLFVSTRLAERRRSLSSSASIPIAHSFALVANGHAFV